MNSPPPHPAPPDGSITWWGVASVELALGGQRLAIDPYLHPDEPRIDVVCITHNDGDHCHEPTLARLEGPRLQTVVVPPSCLHTSTLDSPIHSTSDDLRLLDPHKVRVVRPRLTRSPREHFDGPTSVTAGTFEVEAIDSSERPYRWRPADRTPWPAGTGPFVGPDEFPNNGYLITEASTGLTFYHPGDLHETYDVHRELRGRVDVLFFPGIKLEGTELTLIDAVRPRVIVPIHHRCDDPAFPVPLDLPPDLVLRTTDTKKGAIVADADPDRYRDEVRRVQAAHWYPTPIPPLERLLGLEAQLSSAFGTRLRVLDAAVPCPVEELL